MGESKREEPGGSSTLPEFNFKATTQENRLLVEEAIRGNSEAISKVIELYYKDILYFTIAKVGRQEGEDVAQRAAESIIESIDKLKDPAKVKPWMLAITNNRCMDYMADHKYKTPITISEEDIDGSLREVKDENREFLPEEAFFSKQMRTTVIETIEALPINYADCIRLRYFEQLSVKDIAGVLGVDAKKIENDLYNGKRLFKKRFEECTDTRYHYSVTAVGAVPLLTQIFNADCAEVITPDIAQRFLDSANSHIAVQTASAAAVAGAHATSGKLGGALSAGKAIGAGAATVAVLVSVGIICALLQEPAEAPVPGSEPVTEVAPVQTEREIVTLADMINGDEAAALDGFVSVVPDKAAWMEFVAGIGAHEEDVAFEIDYAYRIFLLEKQDKQLLLFEKENLTTGDIDVFYQFGQQAKLPHMMDVILMFP